jgi:predicted Zn-dependent peptidase
VLENGVTYLSRMAPGNARRVVLGLVVKAGSLVEADDEQGVAHFVEHLAFLGCCPKGAQARAAWPHQLPLGERRPHL